eukprot:gene11916-24962_t
MSTFVNPKAALISCYLLAMIGCLLNYLPIYMNLKLDTSAYENLESIPLNQTLSSRNFLFSIVLSIGATIPLMLDFIFDFVSSRNQSLHPAQLVIWLLFLSNMAFNIFIIGFVAPGLRLEYWGATHSLKIFMLFSCGFYIQNAYGPNIWKLWKIIPTLILLYISQLLGAFSPFNDINTEGKYLIIRKIILSIVFSVIAYLSISWINNIRLKLKAGIRLSTDDIYCSLNLITFTVSAVSVLILGLTYNSFTGLDCNLIGVTIQTYFLTAYTVILTILNIRYIRAKLESDKSERESNIKHMLV